MFTGLLSSPEFLRGLTAAVGCGGCAAAGRRRPSQTVQSCARHAAQFDSAVELLAEHCPCARHRGGPGTRIARRMAEAHAAERGGDGCLPSVRALWFALRDTETDRAFARLRLVFPQRSNGMLCCAFSERPRRWARQRAVAASIAPTVLEQEALAALVLAAGFGHPAADSPDGGPEAAGVLAGGGFAEAEVVPVADLYGRAARRAREAVPVSASTGDYLLRKLAGLAGGVDPARARTADERRRVQLGKELLGMTAQELGRRLSAVLLRLAEQMPERFQLLERARGRARGAPYRPVPDDAGDAALPPPGSPERAERVWLDWTVATLRAQAARFPVMYATNRSASLDRFLTLHLAAHPEMVPRRWADAAADAAGDTRADLLEALAAAAERG